MQICIDTKNKDVVNVKTESKIFGKMKTEKSLTKFELEYFHKILGVEKPINGHKS